MDGAREMAELLTRDDLPPAFERWRVELEPGSHRPTEAREWAGALVLIEAGSLEVDCVTGGQRSFAEGDLLALGWLPITRLRNPGRGVTRLVAVRRHGDVPSEEYLHVTRRTDGGDRR